MAYDDSKDRLVQLFELKDGKGALLVSLMSYNKATPKLQITRSYEKKDETMGYGKMGRLTLEEMKWFKENIDEIIEVMENGGE